MPKYMVTLPEVWYRHYIVEAEDAQAAIWEAKDGNVDQYGEPEYAFDLDSSDGYAEELLEKREGKWPTT